MVREKLLIKQSFSVTVTKLNTKGQILNAFRNK